MPASLEDKMVLVVGRGSAIARAITLAARDAGAAVIVAVWIAAAGLLLWWFWPVQVR